eukprot:Skav218436  [mRNA]  locus=scaffold420:299724:300422:- [translate_table: standard]
MDTDLVSDLKRLIMEKLELDSAKQSMKLIFDTTVLEDSGQSVAAYGIETGSNVMILLENPGPIVLAASITDSTATDDRRPAARSKELHHPISRIEVSAKTFRDQGWGNCKANLYLTLKAPGEGEASVLVRRNLYGTYRHRDYPHGEHPPSIAFEADDDLVAKAEPGCFYQMEYIVGGGGGHKIVVQDWVCKIFHVSSSTPEASERVHFTFPPKREADLFAGSSDYSDSDSDF